MAARKADPRRGTAQGKKKVPVRGPVRLRRPSKLTDPGKPRGKGPRRDAPPEDDAPRSRAPRGRSAEDRAPADRVPRGRTQRPGERAPAGKPSRGRPQTDRPLRSRPPGGKVRGPKKRVIKVTPIEAPVEKDGKLRLNRYLASAGVCSRRAADEYIAGGRVMVNGELTTELGTRIHPDDDDVRVDGSRVYAERKVYILFNKPKSP